MAYPGFNYKFKGFLEFDDLVSFERWACKKAYKSQWPHVHPDSNYEMDSNGIPVRGGSDTSEKNKVLCLIDNTVECDYNENDLLSKQGTVDKGYFQRS